MTKSLLLQVPDKFSEVLPVFYSEAKKHTNFDKIYVWTDSKREFNVGSDCYIYRHSADRDFSANMRLLLKNVKEDIFFVCCEDHIMTENNDLNVINDTYDWFCKTKDAGYLRLTYADKAPVKKRGNYFILSKKYNYYISLQPGIWRKDYFSLCLRDGESAWSFEIKGSARAKKHRTMQSYMVNENKIYFTNFYREGKYYRRQFVDYAIKNNIKLDHEWPVYHKKKLVHFHDYIKEHIEKNADISN